MRSSSYALLAIDPSSNPARNQFPDPTRPNLSLALAPISGPADDVTKSSGTPRYWAHPTSLELNPLPLILRATLHKLHFWPSALSLLHCILHTAYSLPHTCTVTSSALANRDSVRRVIDIAQCVPGEAPRGSTSLSVYVNSPERRTVSEHARCG